MQGWRDNMEDSHTLNLQLPSHDNISLFGVFDGHSGSGASNWCSKNLHEYFDKLNNFNDENIVNTLIEADREFCNIEERGINTHGTTAVMAIVDHSDNENKEITIINIGDSRCIIGKQNCEHLCMTVDHKPENQIEEDRIKGAGGFVAKNRVDGQLAVSRSIGDSGYKCNKDLPVEQQKIIPIPDITRETVSTDDFLFLCCDGFFETSFTDESVIDFIRNYLRESDDPAYVLSKLVEEVLKLGSKDNLTCILVQFKDGTNYARDPEFIAGRWYDNGNVTFQKAYREFAEAWGLTLDEAKAMFEENNS